MLGAALALAAPVASAAPIVADGAFNDPYEGSGWTTYYAGSSIGPWQVTEGGVSLIGSLWQEPSPGGGSLTLDGETGPGAVTQALALTPGQAYVLSFQFSGNMYANPHVKMEVSVGSLDTTLDDHWDSTWSYANMEWKLETMNFVAGATNTLTFKSLDAAIYTWGPVVTEVSIVPASGVPEPAAWAMLAVGFAGVGAAHRRASQRRSAGAS